jgi:phosphatidylglycerophosphate synthase
MHKRWYYIVNAITLYRLLAAPVLFILILTKNINVFSWLLPVSFFTDLIDGYLARKFKVISALGSRLDSIADDLTMAAAIVAVFAFYPLFIRQHIVVIAIMLVLYLVQLALALTKYKRISEFHTYIAKGAAILQGSFLILLFLLQKPIPALFYAAAFATILDLLEEIMLVVFLPGWQSNVGGLYWFFKKRKSRG